MTVTVNDAEVARGTLRIVDDERAPVFDDGASAERSVPEHSGPGVDVGLPVRATDANNDTLTYSVGGPDLASFDLDTATGQIRKKAGVVYDHDGRAPGGVSGRRDGCRRTGKGQSRACGECPAPEDG